MHRNFKLKYAVMTALSLIAFSAHQSSYALGLGDIDVKSRLGQPLKAKVNVLGASDLKGTSCLRLGTNSDLSHVNFLLGPVTGNAAKLTVTSKKLINEPILNLSIIAGCENAITRDYVLLLDPPLTTQNLHAEISNSQHPIIVQKIDTSAEISTVVQAKPQKNIIKKAQKKRRPRKTAKVQKRQTSKTAVEKYNDPTRTKLNDTPKDIGVEIKPMLSISGGSSVAYANTVGLRLDRQLTFTPGANSPVITDNTVMDDEVTVMNNRLTHLQEQITKLQTQNLKLTADNKLKSIQLAQEASPTSTLTKALPYLGAGMLLVGGYFGFHWLRRRQLVLQNHNTEAIWIDENKQLDKSETNESEITEQLADETENIFANLDFGIKKHVEKESPSDATMASTFESTKTEEQPIVIEDEQQFSVLDHADVFLSHGRATLAIQLLQNHLLEHPKQSVTIWLFLLDLLAKEDLPSLYEEVSADCQLHFNVKIPNFSTSEKTANESLEDFPHLAKGLEEVWNTPAAMVYLDDLIYNNRLEPRAGLSKNLIEELVLLRSMTQDSVNSADVIKLDDKKRAIIEKKEALLETRKAEKLKTIAEAEKLAKEKTKAEAQTETAETNFEFTLIER